MGGTKPHDEGTARRVRFAVDEHGGVYAGTTTAPMAGHKTAVDGDDATRRVLDAWMAQFGADVAPDEVVAGTKKRDEEDEAARPSRCSRRWRRRRVGETP
ncbi:hypothetical protein PF002_g29756 [Phytophthora fragariae]|uniref:Uncharacterized protein n=2 Tax=Phytophthora fragariae TaxID=53985 RepID=A0A6A3VV21_9STRA|nr:hypothetical protein PF002_g29756 [Phytophthora fragariae]